MILCGRTRVFVLEQVGVGDGCPKIQGCEITMYPRLTGARLSTGFCFRYIFMFKFITTQNVMCQPKVTRNLRFLCGHTQNKFDLLSSY